MLLERKYVIENNKRFKILMIFISFIMVLSTTLTILFYKINDDEVLHIPLEFDTLISNDEGIVEEDITINNFSTRYNDVLKKWFFCMTVRSNSEKMINTEDEYNITFYDINSNIVGTTEERFTFTIEPNSEMTINIVLNFDGSLLNSISIKRKNS